MSSILHFCFLMRFLGSLHKQKEESNEGGDAGLEGNHLPYCRKWMETMKEVY